MDRSRRGITNTIPGNQSALEINLTSSGADAIVIVADSSGTAISGANVVLSAKERSTDALGHAKFTNQPTGQQKLTVTNGGTVLFDGLVNLALT